MSQPPRCVRCRWTEAAHSGSDEHTVMPWVDDIPCASYEAPAPRWLRVFNGFLGRLA